MKFSRYGSHLKCLKDPENTIDAFMERAARLGECLGPVLVQLKPNWGLDLERLRCFLQATPKNQRWTFEFRDPSWLCDAVFDVLRRHNAALCIHDLLQDHPRVVPSDWVYMRLHGDRYGGSYSYQFLAGRARRVCEYLSEVLDVYAFFNNDAEGHAARNALRLREYVGRRTL